MARRASVLVSRSLYHVGLITIIAAVMWVATGIYLAIGKDFKLEIDTSILDPINPTLDQEVVKRLTGRLKVEGDLTAAPESTLSGTESTTQSGIESETESGTGSGTINVDGSR